jgi:hypothetical protein
MNAPELNHYEVILAFRGDVVIEVDARDETHAEELAHIKAERMSIAGDVCTFTVDEVIAYDPEVEA